MKANQEEAYNMPTEIFNTEASLNQPSSRN